MRVAASCRSGICCAVAGIRSSRGLVNIRLGFSVCALAALAVAPAPTLAQGLEGPGSTAPPATNHVEQVSALELRQLFLQLQEQLQATQLAIEQTRRETKAAAAQNTEALATGLEAMQEAFAAQRARDWAAMQSSNELVLVVAGTVAAMSLLTMLVMTFFQWRMSKGLTEISAALPAVLGIGGSAAGLSPADPRALYLPGLAPQSEKAPRAPLASPQPTSKSAPAPNLPLGSRLFFDAGAVLRRRRIRALRTVVIVCLICAAVLALLLYLVTCRKLGFGPLHAVLRI